jgi:hypothetical protein
MACNYITKRRAGRSIVSGFLCDCLICERWGESVQNWTCVLLVTVWLFMVICSAWCGDRYVKQDHFFQQTFDNGAGCTHGTFIWMVNIILFAYSKDKNRTNHRENSEILCRNTFYIELIFNYFLNVS